jgi:hypothetical protein
MIWAVHHEKATLFEKKILDTQGAETTLDVSHRNSRAASAPKQDGRLTVPQTTGNGQRLPMEVIMATQLTNREKLAFKIDHLSDSEIEEINEYISIMESMRRAHQQGDAFDDELVAALSSAYENRRAQQVYEWEAVRQRADYGAIKVRAAHQ